MKLIETHRLTDFSHLNLFRTRYTDRRGKERTWVFASRRSQPLSSGRALEVPDAVVIVPFHSARQELVAIKEFRVTLGGYQIGFPAGLIDPGETVDEAARRELREETGLSLRRVLYRSPAVFSSSGMTDESVCLVFVECEGTPSADANESSEDIHVLFLDKAAARRLDEDDTLKLDVKAWTIIAAYGRGFDYFPGH